LFRIKTVKIHDFFPGFFKAFASGPAGATEKAGRVTPHSARPALHYSHCVNNKQVFFNAATSAKEIAEDNKRCAFAQ
jgi:hypothetical protein